MRPNWFPAAACVLACAAAAPAEPPAPDGDAVIRGKAGPSEVRITTTRRVAGAIHSLTWNDREFLDSFDHGRQLQSAANFDCGQKYIDEVFNPTEAGSRADGRGERSSSRLLSLRAEGGELETTTRMAFWLAPGEKSLGNPARNDKALSDHLVRKRVRIGYKGLPHAIRYDVTFTVPPGERHTYAQFEAATAYLPPEFSRFQRFDAATGALKELPEADGEQADPVVLSTPDGSHALGVFSPDQPSRGYDTAGYGRWRFRDEKVVKWNCVFRVRDPKGVAAGEYRYRLFVVVGSREDVRGTLVALAKEFEKRE